MNLFRVKRIRYWSRNRKQCDLLTTVYGYFCEVSFHFANSFEKITSVACEGDDEGNIIEDQMKRLSPNRPVNMKIRNIRERKIILKL